MSKRKYGMSFSLTTKTITNNSTYIKEQITTSCFCESKIKRESCRGGRSKAQWGKLIRVVAFASDACGQRRLWCEQKGSRWLQLSLLLMSDGVSRGWRCGAAIGGSFGGFAWRRRLRVLCFTSSFLWIHGCL